MMLTVIPLLTAFGIGAIVTTLIQAWISHHASSQQRAFAEKKESYVGFLDSLHQSEIEGTQAAALNVGHWENRIALVGSAAVVEACEWIRETNPIDGRVHPDRPNAMSALKHAMRVDIAIEH